MDKFRFLGYYHVPNQDMKPEIQKIEEAKVLASLLTTSISSLKNNPDTDDELKEIIKDGAVLIFKDEKGNLYAFFTKNNTARISNVKFSKGSIVQVPLKYKAWFYPGKPIRITQTHESYENIHIENSSITKINNSENTMKSKTTIPAPEVNSKAYENVFDKMYITNVEKRLRELNSPSDNDRKRWVWELIQNAKDTIAKDPNRNSIDIRIDVDGDIVRFRHNGAPFTPDARLGLLYKYSEDKENQESTGRFGTGFLTTHCLSKVVDIESNMYSDSECSKLCGFSVTMYRDGLIASELIDGLKKMRKSEVFYNETFEWTTFTYHVSSESGRRAIKLGIENFYENIAQTMLFCQELSSVVLDDNGEITTIERKPTINLTSDIKLSEFVITSDISLTRRFIHTSYYGYDEDLSKRYRAKRNIRIDAAIEIDSENNLVGNKDKTSFFCVMPLVGIETQLNEPLIINSPDFEPDEERQSLLLTGLTWNEEKDVITETGINRKIYEHIFSLYDKIVCHITSNRHFDKLYFLANGLDRIKSHEKLDKEWYKRNVIDRYREVLMKFPIANAQDGSGYKKLDECIIVNELQKDNEDKLYYLLEFLCPSKLVKDNHEWSNHLWKEGLAVWNTETLCKVVEGKVNWNNLGIVNINLSVWYNDFLKHISTYNELYLKEYALMPNMNGVLLKKNTDDFKQGEHINSFVINLLEKLGKDIKPNLLHEDIISVSLESKYNSQSCCAEINRLAKLIISGDSCELNKVTKLLPLISIIPNNTDKYNQEFLKRRKNFFNICKDLYQLNEATFICDNSLVEGAWKETDEWFVTNILNSLKSLGCISKLPNDLNAKWINATLKSLHTTTEKLNVYAVLPNQNGTFCLQKDLFEDSGIPQELKDNIFTNIDINYKNILLHEDVDAAEFSVYQKKTIANFASELKCKFTELTSCDHNHPHYYRGKYHYYPQTILDNIALYVLSLMPKDHSLDLYKHQNSLYNISSLLLQEQTYTKQTINYDVSDLWQIPNEYTASKICEKITELKSIENTAIVMKNCGKNTVMETLNNFYSFLLYQNIPHTNMCIFPNQNGEYRQISELKREEGDINDRLKNIIGMLVPSDQEYRALLMDKRSLIQPQAALGVKEAYNLIDDKIYENYKSPIMWKDKNYIEAVHQLIEVWEEESGGLFNEFNFPKSKPIEDSIVLNVVWNKEKRQLLMDVSSKLTEEQLQIISENNMEISNLSSKVKDLEDENAFLRNKLAELGIYEHTRGNVMLGVSMNGNELATQEQITESNEAKELVLQKLERDGFDVSNADSQYTVIHGVVRDNTDYPLVVKSCKNKESRVWINPNEWQQLFKPNSMLWIHFGGGKICPIKAFELFTYQDKLTLSFDTINILMDERINKIMDVMHYFNNVHLNLATLNPDKQRADLLKEYLFNDNNANNSDLDDKVEL